MAPRRLRLKWACGFERVEGPFGQADVAGEGFFALEEFEGAADFAVAVVGEDAGHVGVQVGSICPRTPTRAMVKPTMVGPVEGAEDLATGLVGDDEGGVGFGFEVGFVPDRFLDFDATVESGRVVHLRIWIWGVMRKPTVCSRRLTPRRRENVRRGTEDAEKSNPRAQSLRLRSGQAGMAVPQESARVRRRSFCGSLGEFALLGLVPEGLQFGRGISARVVPCSRGDFSISWSGV